MRCRWVVGFCISSALLVSPARAPALPLQAGSILVIDGVVLSEYTTSGQLIQQLLVPHPAQLFPLTGPRDLVVRSDGVVAIYNDLFDPRLTLWNPVTDTFEHHAFSGWDSANCISCGGIAAKDGFVYATDHSGSSDVLASGVVRYEGATSSFERFHHPFGFNDLNIGLDGLLYALSRDEELLVFDPSTMDLLRTLPLSPFARSIAVDGDGAIYVGEFGGTVSRLAPDGAVLGSLQVSSGGTVVDIDVDANGRIVMTNFSHGVFVTDTAFSTLESPGIFSVWSAGFFVAFSSPVPEPSLLSLATAALGLALAAHMRRRSRSAA
jgi:hypothetical protein